MYLKLKNVSPKRYIQVLSPSMSVTLFGKWVFVDMIKLKLNSYRFKLAPKALTSVPIRRRKCGHRDTRMPHATGGRDWRDAAISRRAPRDASHHQKLGRDEEEFSLGAFREHGQSCDLRLPLPAPCEEIPVVVSPPSLWLFVTAALQSSARCEGAGTGEAPRAHGGRHAVYSDETTSWPGSPSHGPPPLSTTGSLGSYFPSPQCRVCLPVAGVTDTRQPGAPGPQHSRCLVAWLLTSLGPMPGTVHVQGLPRWGPGLTAKEGNGKEPTPVRAELLCGAPISSSPNDTPKLPLMSPVPSSPVIHETQPPNKLRGRRLSPFFFLTIKESLHPLLLGMPAHFPAYAILFPSLRRSLPRPRLIQLNATSSMKLSRMHSNQSHVMDV